MRPLRLAMCFVLLAVALLGMASAATWQPTNKSVIAYWKFNETNSSNGPIINDFSGNRFNLTAGGSPNLITGKLGNAGNTSMLAGGDNSYNRNITGALQLNLSNFTIEFWFRRPNLTLTNDAGTNPTIIDSSGTVDSSQTGYRIYMDRTADGRITFAFGNLSFTTLGSYGDNLFHHIAVSRNATNITVSIDGAHINSTRDETSFNSSARLFVGAGWQTQVSGDSRMTIDNVGIYSQAMSISDIAALYNGGSGIELRVNDVVTPNLTIHEPNSTQSSRTFSINFSATDDFGIDSCVFNITRGASVEVANTFVANCANTTTTVSTDADYVLWVKVNDTSGNTNISQSGFSVSSSINPGGGGGNGGGGGGGGGGSITNTIIQVVTGNVTTGKFCEPYRPPLDEAWQKFTADKTFANFTFVFRAFLGYSICKDAATIVPL